MRGLIKELLKIKTYPYNNGDCGVRPLHNHPNITYKEAAETLLRCNDRPHATAVGLWALTRCYPLSVHDITLPDGRSIGAIDALVEAIRLDRSLSVAYGMLSTRIQSNPAKEASAEIRTSVLLHDGRLLDTRQLLLEAIRIDPSNSVFFENLGYLVSKNEVARLSDGRHMQRNELFIEALRLDPNDPYTYTNFAHALTASETVMVGGRPMTYLDLASETLRIDPTFGLTYHYVALKLRTASSEVVLLGKSWTQRQLLVEAIRFSPCLFQSYRALARTTHPDESVKLHDGRVLNRYQLYIQAAKFDSSGVVMRGMDRIDELKCFWSPDQHKAFGGKIAELMATLLLALQRLVSNGLSVPMDPAVLEEMLSYWCFADSSDLIRDS